MRSIKQPGPPVPERIQWLEVRGRAFSFTLEAGLPLLEAARRGFAVHRRVPLLAVAVPLDLEMAVRLIKT